MSVNLLLEDESRPVVWRGPVIAGTVKQFWTNTIWHDIDYMFIDCPPGTGDVPLTVFQSIPLDGIIIVEKNIAVIDGTAPHIYEPKLPGICEKMINLGENWDEKKLKKYIAKQLKRIKDKYAIPRKTRLIYDAAVDEPIDEEVENYPVRLVLSRDGFFKKITLQSLRASALRGSDEQKLKEGDRVILEEDGENVDELLFITNKQKIYKTRVCEFDQMKTSSLGDFVPAKLGFEKDEKPIAFKALRTYEPAHNLIFIFANGKGVKVPLPSYETKGNRKKLVAAYSDAAPIVAAIYESEPFDLLLGTKSGKGAIINTKLIPIKTTRTSIGSALIALKKDDEVKFAEKDFEKQHPDTAGLRKTKIPATPGTLKK
jgi:DNA gyrase subunit A